MASPPSPASTPPSPSLACQLAGAPALLRQLAKQHRRCLGLQAPPSGPSALVSAERLKQYDEEGYGTMTHDRTRNAVYRNAIRQALAGGCERFLEIGCGGDACLTRMVLDLPGTTVAAFEGNEGAASAAYAGLLHTGYCESRYSIHAVLSTAPELREVAARSPGGVQAVLQEVLGYIASREGVVPVFRDLQRRLGRGAWTAVPSHCATFFTPTLVQLSDVRHNITHALSLLGSTGGHAVQCRGRAALFGGAGAGGGGAVGSAGAQGGGGGGASASAAASSSSSSSSSSAPCSSAAVLSAAFLLVSRLPLREDVCPFWKVHSKALGTGMPYCGALEHLALEEDMEAQLRQLRTTTFTATRTSVVNSLSCFIWVGFNPPAESGGGSDAASVGASAGRGSGGGGGGGGGSSSGSSPSASSRYSSGGSSSSSSEAPASPPPRATRSAGPMDLGPGGGTAYPYGVPGLPTLRGRALALSTAQSDSLELVANNWPNLVVWLQQPLTLEAGQQLQVQSWADLEADPHVYSWRYRVLTPSPAARRKRQRDGAEEEAEAGPWSEPLTLDSQDGAFHEI